jgi:hypothetical protein
MNEGWLQKAKEVKSVAANARLHLQEVKRKIHLMIIARQKRIDDIRGLFIQRKDESENAHYPTKGGEIDKMCQLEDLVKDGSIILDMEKWLTDSTLWYGDRPMGSVIPTLSLGGYYTLRLVVGWDGHMDVRGWSSDELLLSLGSKDTLNSIMALIQRLHGVVIIYDSKLSRVGICFYTPRMGIIHIYRRSSRVFWYEDDISTTEVDGIHDDKIDDLILRFESSLVDSGME